MSTATVANPHKRKLVNASTAKAATTKKIWVDLDNSPHVPFFRPIIDELRSRGYHILVTARDAYQVKELIEFYGVTATVIGKHHGKNKAMKAIGTLWRAAALSQLVRKEKPDLAMCHGSRAMLLVSALLRIPCLMLMDYEFSTIMPPVKPTWYMLPSVVSGDHCRKGSSVIKYPGIKEDVYLSRFEPDETLRERLGIPRQNLLITVRPPATEAHYHNPEGEKLLDAALTRFVAEPNVTIILLPRSKKQELDLVPVWQQHIASGRIIIPQHAEDGLNLIWNSDLVISGGGTMNREAAAMEVPVYSIFRGKIGAVDHYLAEQSRLVLIESQDDVRNKIKAVPRERVRQKFGDGRSPAFDTIIRNIVSMVEKRSAAEPSSEPLLASLPKTSSPVSIHALCEDSLLGLTEMFDADHGLFCCRVAKKDGRLLREGISQRYTVMTLLGLHKWMQSGEMQPFDLEAIFSALIRDRSWISNIGDLGLLLWLTASAFPHRLQELWSILDPTLAWRRYESPERFTMEVSWFLTGCAELAKAGVEHSSAASEGASAAYRALLQNQGPSGAFGHMSKHGSLNGRLRGRIGSFADQVYPIFALTQMSRAFHIEEPLAHAVACAKVICDLQGDMGEWWWHYDAMTGKVISKHPVYSVHQEAMAPMALFALADATGYDYSEPIFKGLQWITGRNELQKDMRDREHHLVWRRFYQSRFRSYVNNLRNYIGIPSSAAGIKVLYECRPYELGWLLYALAGR